MEWGGVGCNGGGGRRRRSDIGGGGVCHGVGNGTTRRGGTGRTWIMGRDSDEVESRGGAEAEAEVRFKSSRPRRLREGGEREERGRASE